MNEFNAASIKQNISYLSACHAMEKQLLGLDASEETAHYKPSGSGRHIIWVERRN